MKVITTLTEISSWSIELALVEEEKKTSVGIFFTKKLGTSHLKRICKMRSDTAHAWFVCARAQDRTGRI